MKKLILKLFLTLTFVILFIPLTANAEFSSPFKVTGEKFSGNPGENFVAKINIKVPKGYFIYADEMDIEFQSLEGILVKNIEYPDPTPWFDPHANKVEMVYDKNFDIVISGQIPTDAEAGIHDLLAIVSLRGCTPKTCLFPEKKEALLSLRIDGDIVVDAKPARKIQVDRRIPYDFPAILLAGIAAALTPCVWPLIPIVLLIAGIAGHYGCKKQCHYLVFLVLGLILVYAVFGWSVATFGKGVSALFGHKWFIVGMIFMFVLMALATAGIIPFPTITKEIPFLKKSGALGAFLGGIGVGLLASPCTAPIIAAVASYVAWQGNSVRGAYLFATYGLGLSISITIVAVIAAEVRHALSSKVVVWSRRVLAVLMLLPAIYYVNALIPSKPDASGIAWVKPEIAYKIATKEQRAMMFDFTAKWCPSCKKLDKYFKDQMVKKLSYQLIPVRVDVTFKSDENDKLLKKFDVRGAPAVVFTSPSGKIYKDLTIYSTSKDDLIMAMQKAIGKASVENK